jgi:hypothetical protein
MRPGIGAGGYSTKQSNVEEGKHICTLYTGEIPKEGYAVAFHSHG